MAAPVRIEARAWNDIRFVTLARLLGMSDPDLALIKVARLWSWQTEHFIPERPTYVVDADTIESVLGAGGPAALVRSRLATPVSGGYRLHGTEGQIEWCVDLSSTRQLAGRARAAGAKRDALGRLLPKSLSEQDYNSPAQGPAGVQQPPAAIQRASSDSPAKSSAPSPSPSPEDQNPSPRAILPSPVPSTTSPTREPSLDQLWSELELERQRVAVKLGIPLLPLVAHDEGRDLLARMLVDATGKGKRAELAAQVRNAIAVAGSEAEADPAELQWFSGAIFSARNFRRLAAAPPPRTKRKPPQPSPRVELEDRGGLVSLEEIAAAQAIIVGRASKETA